MRFKQRAYNPEDEKLVEKLNVMITTRLLKRIERMARARRDSTAETVRALLDAGLRAYGRSKENA